MDSERRRLLMEVIEAAIVELPEPTTERATANLMANKPILRERLADLIWRAMTKPDPVDFSMCTDPNHRSAPDD